MFPNDEAARKWVEGIRWPEGSRCLKCNSGNIQCDVAHKTMTHRCRTCRKWFSVRTGTVMQSSKLGLQVWVIGVYLLNTDLRGQSSMKLLRDLDVAQKTAWHLAHRIREAWEDNGGSLFGGPVEADETSVGDKRKNMSNAKRKALKEAGAGRGVEEKAAVAGARDRATGKIAAPHVPSTDVPHVAGFVAAHTEDSATVYTDDVPVYDVLEAWYNHETVKHSVGEYVRDMARTNGVESF